MNDAEFLRALASHTTEGPGGTRTGLGHGDQNRLQHIADKLMEIDAVQFCENCGWTFAKGDLDDLGNCEECAQDAAWWRTAPGHGR